LSVPRTSHISVIRASYIALAWRHHPDHGGSHERMAAINRAWHDIQASRRWDRT
jgi:curved DNA-binding protein CbpA